MEMGESDLNRILSVRLHPENARFDISFTRHYWKEMLECVLEVHQNDIVHSDLKPANFLLVQGRLKLIDFGIANAIDIDNTVNVHRETNVGTPNYMSPESLQDTNHLQRSASGPDGAIGKLMKLGKPSDIWSLGCILYQMVYGKPPFAHIANQYQRIMAIINSAVVIEYPLTGVGGAPVPSCLRRTLRRCLNRDFTQRPTAEQLLDERDCFLYPDMENEGAVAMTEELLGQILAKVVERCRDPKRGPPSDAELATYPKGFFGKIRGRLEEG
jgi:serine/threonine-protein kinase TTK/MPS1